MRLVLAATAVFVGAAASAAELPEGAYGWMADLAGHCWSAAYPDGTRDRQCYEAQYDRFLRGTIEIVAAGTERPPYRGDSVSFWDPQRSEIAVHYWSSAGNHGVMTGRVEDDAITFGGIPRDDGAPAVRTIWTRLDAESFRVVQQRQDGETWVEALALVYRRDP